MPLFDYLCQDCGKYSEVLVTSSSDVPQCKGCNSTNLKKVLSPTSSLSGVSVSRMPGPGDTSCCGSNPSESGCAGPGSCCGRSFA